MARRGNGLMTIHSAGGLLPPDLLRKVLDPKEQLPGNQAQDYNLPPGDRINEAITASWNRLCRHWADFGVAREKLGDRESGTGVTNEKWNIPLLRELGFGLLPTSAGPEIDGRTYAINRFFGSTPIHLIGCCVSLDHRAAGVRGAAAANPHGLVQEFLNRKKGSLWAIVSNGLWLRILRDNQALSRQCYLEFDLDAMFSGEVFADFALFWLMAHASRFIPRDGDRPESCWLEQWTKIANDQGTRALGELRSGVETALETLGQGFVGHPHNTVLRQELRSGQLSLNNFHGQLLRVVYRLIFLFVAEGRIIEGNSLLHPPDDTDSGKQARDRFASHYSTSRLRDLASRIRGSRHGDLWQQFNILVGALSGDDRFGPAREALGLPILGSFLWSPKSTIALNAPSLNEGYGTELSNADFLEAIRHLAFIRQDKILRPIDYRNIGVEEIGGVYESLLALTPQINGDGARFTFAEFSGNERKTSGSYYTPDSLVQCLLDSALDPVVEETIKGKTGSEAESALLSLKVCDPAVGSGHFLVGAAHRLARHLSRIRALAQGEGEPSPLLYQQALRDVIGRCLYGVDINPMSAELCRVSLWLEALEPGKPLSFLDHHIRVGNSLLGTTPDLIAKGIPDDAFNAIEGDDKKACVYLKKKNKAERKGLGPLFAQWDAETQAVLARAAEDLELLPDDSPESVSRKEMDFLNFLSGEVFSRKKLLADAWCTAFIIQKYFQEPGFARSAVGITQGLLNDIALGQVSANDQSLIDQIRLLSTRYRFFHWHMAFPEVFTKGGFDVVIGNPPWEQLELQSLVHIDRFITGSQHFIESSAKFQFTGKGRKNLYACFCELSAAELARLGHIGLVLPTGILQDQPAAKLSEHLSRTDRIASVYDFENRRKDRDGEKWFPDAHPQQRFCLVTITHDQKSTKFVFDVGDLKDIFDKDRIYYQSFEDIQRYCHSEFRVPLFRTEIDARIASEAHRKGVMLGALIKGDSPMMRSGLIFNAEPDTKRHKKTCSSNNMLPGMSKIYEGSYIHQFDHRLATFDGGVHRYLTDIEKNDPNRLVTTETYIPTNMLEARLQTLSFTRTDWLFLLRRQARATDSFISICAIVPYAGAEGNVSAFFFRQSMAQRCSLLCANMNSFIFNYLTCMRQSGPNLNKNVYLNLPICSENFFKEHEQPYGNAYQICWYTQRVLELTYTAWDLEFFAQDCGWGGPPFRWDNDRRFMIRCELDAAYFHLYLGTHKEWTEAATKKLLASFPTPRHAVDYIMETFPIVKRRDEAAHGHYRTKDTILEIYDELAEAIQAGQPYKTRLDPPPADPGCCHSAREQP